MDTLPSPRKDMGPGIPYPRRNMGSEIPYTPQPTGPRILNLLPLMNGGGYLVNPKADPLIPVVQGRLQ